MVNVLSLQLIQNIPIERQRLIFQGKVLRDDKKLSEYGMYNNLLIVLLHSSHDAL